MGGVQTLPDRQTLPYRQPGTVGKVREILAGSSWITRDGPLVKFCRSGEFGEGSSICVRQALPNYNRLQSDRPSADRTTATSVSVSPTFAAGNLYPTVSSGTLAEKYMRSFKRCSARGRYDGCRMRCTRVPLAAKSLRVIYQHGLIRAKD